MARKVHTNLSEVVGSFYTDGIILSVDSANETCDVSVNLPPELGGEAVCSSVPLFYHCTPTSTAVGSGGLKDASKAFKKDDEVIVLVNISSGQPTNYFVMGFVEGKKLCCDYFPPDDPETLNVDESVLRPKFDFLKGITPRTPVSHTFKYGALYTVLADPAITAHIHMPPLEEVPEAYTKATFNDVSINGFSDGCLEWSFGTTFLGMFFEHTWNGVESSNTGEVNLVGYAYSFQKLWSYVTEHCCANPEPSRVLDYISLEATPSNPTCGDAGSIGFIAEAKVSSTSNCSDVTSVGTPPLYRLNDAGGWDLMTGSSIGIPPCTCDCKSTITVKAEVVIGENVTSTIIVVPINGCPDMPSVLNVAVNPDNVVTCGTAFSLVVTDQDNNPVTVVVTQVTGTASGSGLNWTAPATNVNCAGNSFFLVSKTCVATGIVVEGSVIVSYNCAPANTIAGGNAISCDLCDCSQTPYVCYPDATYYWRFKGYVATSCTDAYGTCIAYDCTGTTLVGGRTIPAGADGCLEPPNVCMEACCGITYNAPRNIRTCSFKNTTRPNNCCPGEGL